MLEPPCIIAFANQKGGVGKTTTAVNLAACLAKRRKKILLLDIDPQANATSALGEEKHPGGSIYQPLLGEAGLIDKIIPTKVSNLDLVPSEMDLAGVEVDIARSERYLHRLQDAMRPLLEQRAYHYVFLDCPPSLGILTCNALTAAQSLIIPVQCEYLALEGLSMIARLVGQLRDGGANPGLKIEGIVMTMFDGRTRLAAQVAEEVRKHFAAEVYNTLIPRNIRISEAPSFGCPVSVYDPRSPGANAYKLLAREFLQRRRPLPPAPDPAPSDPSVAEASAVPASPPEAAAGMESSAVDCTPAADDNCPAPVAPASPPVDPAQARDDDPPEHPG